MANKIAENLYAQVDDEGREILRFAYIIDHRKDSTALTEEKSFIKVQGGESKCIKTTKGWEMLVEWKGGTSSWLRLRDVKEASPVELAEYAVTMDLDKEPAFTWWVDYVSKKRKMIIKKAKSKYWRTTQKCGIQIPKTPEEALRIDRETGTDFWEKAMIKEMTKAKVSYELVDGCMPEEVRSNQVPALRGYQEISCHIIFDVKMDFTLKARFVANGSTTDTPSALTYSSVLSRDRNAYLNAPCKERIWFVVGHECGHEMKGRVMKLIRALYGLKSSGASWRKMFKDFIVTHLKFTPSRVDGDMYYRKNSKPDGTLYYELLLSFEIKNDEYGPPTTYLGGQLEQFTIPGTNERPWSLLSTQYAKAAVANVEAMLKEEDREFKTASSGKAQRRNPIPSGYKSELDTAEEYDPEHHSRFQQLIRILRWAVELGRIDIHIGVAIMPQYSANPRVGHLEAVYCIVHYLKRNPKVRLVMDPATPIIDRSGFNDRADWAEFYGDVVKEDSGNLFFLRGASFLA
ncbi:hypothetical protein ACHAWF_002305 [Thalassiosira exigua]